MEAILEQIKRTGRPVINDPTLIINTRGINEIIKGNMQPAYIIVEGPAMAFLNTLGDRRLSKTVEVLGRKVNKVGKVRASIKPGTKVVYIWEADNEDNEAIEVKRNDNDTTINLSELLIPAQLAIESGHYEKYALEFSQPTGPVYPALKFDMEKKVESGLTAAEKRRRAEAAGLIPPKPKKSRKAKTGSDTAPEAPKVVDSEKAPADETK